MATQTALELKFGDGEYRFDLRLPWLAELQEKRGSVFELYGRVMRGRYIFEGEPLAIPEEGGAHAEDLWETIRIALIGGGSGVVDGSKVEMTAGLAQKLVERYCHPAPLRESWAIAASILAARVVGFDPGPLAEAGQAPAPARKPRKASTSRKSLRTAESSAAIGEP